MNIDYRPSARLRLIIARRRDDDGLTPVGAKMMDYRACRRDEYLLPVGAKIMDGRPLARR